MQNATPEDPDALALNVEERNGFEPPTIGLFSEKFESGQDEFEVKRFVADSMVNSSGSTLSGAGSEVPRNSPKKRRSERS